MGNKTQRLKQLLDKKLEQEKFRQLRSLIPPAWNKQVVAHFSSNDFLGLTDHPQVKKKSIEYVLEWGTGSSPSRVLISHLEAQRLLQEACAKLLGRDAALFFPSQHQLLAHLFAPFVASRSPVFLDCSLSPSYKQAVLSAGLQPILFHHNDPQDLKERLEQHSHGTTFRFIMIEALSEVEGDLTNLCTILSLAKEYDAFLCVDETYSFGILGDKGVGLTSCYKEIDFVCGSLNKTGGSFGAFLTMSDLMKEVIVHLSETYSPLTPLPPAALGAIDAILTLIPTLDKERKKLFQNKSKLSQLIAQKGWQTDLFEAPLFPLTLSETILGDTLAQLFAVGIITSTVRPILGKKRLKLTTMVRHTDRDFALLDDALPALEILAPTLTRESK